MQKFNLANRFGLAISFFFLSVFPSTAAWAQKTSGTATAQGPQQVIVANTAAQPVPVTVQKTQYYQASQVLSCSGPFTNVTFNVPSGKTLIVRNVNVFAGSYGAGDT